MSEAKTQPPRTPRCPVCNRPVLDLAHRPFCSRRCADIDLGRWFNESYRVPAKETSEAEDEAPSTPQSTGEAEKE